MKNHLIFTFLLITLYLRSSAQDKYFDEKFITAKSLLSEGNTTKTIPILKDLLKIDPNNANLHYLIGVCYTEEKEVTDKSIFHLEKSMKSVSTDYDPTSYKEKRTPIFVYYFLTIAYSQNSQCEKAKDAYYYFTSVYGGEWGDFYTTDSRKWVEKCKEIPVVAEEIKIIPTEIAARKIEYVSEIITKKIEYTTQSSLYGVQIGAFSKLVPVFEFKNIKNIEAFMDNNGMIRYVVGHFSFRKQAESLLNAVKEAGYPDAFIVDVNKEKKYSEEVITVNNQSFKHPAMKPKIDYKVQIGAFKDSIPFELAKKYLEIEKIEEFKQGNLTILTSGKFSNYVDATKHKDDLLNLGIPEAFIVSFQGNKKVTAQKEE